MSKAKMLITFAIGALTGSLATYFYVKDKYEKIVQEEIKSIKEKLGKEEDKEEPVVAEQPDEVTAEEYEEAKKEMVHIIRSFGYDPEAEDATGTEVITPEEFAECEEYTTDCLTFFAGDGILADQNGDEILIQMIGKESLDHFGDYEENVVHVRNHNVKSDYEIHLDPRSYSEVYPDED